MERTSTYKPLLHFIENGVGVIPIDSETRAPIMKYMEQPENFTRDREKLLEYWNQGFTAFAFMPYNCDMVVLDIENKHGVDGLAEFRKWLVDNNIVFPWDVDSPPVYSITPTGGRHYYFKYIGDPLSNTHIIDRAVEVKHKALITAPGSVNNSGSYTLYGDLKNIPPLPYSIKKLLPKKTLESKFEKSYNFQEWRTGEKGQRTLSEIEETIIKQYGHPGEGNRNKFCYEFSKYARKESYNQDNIKQYLRSICSLSEREIQTCINSAFRG